MNLKKNMNIIKCSTGSIRLVACALLASAFTGCVTHVHQPREVVYAQPPPVYVQAPVVVQEEYVYYPRYRVYYSSRSHQYIYQDRRAWVSRPTPPGVSVDVLFAAPSVRVDFHDHPSNHHASVERQYPKKWAPPANSHGHKEEHN
jgi:hypothetical protein